MYNSEYDYILNKGRYINVLEVKSQYNDKTRKTTIKVKYVCPIDNNIRCARGSAVKHPNDKHNFQLAYNIALKRAYRNMYDAYRKAKRIKEDISIVLFRNSDVLYM